MFVAGIDFSSHAIDIVRIPLDEPGAPLWDRFELEGTDAFERARDVPQTMPGRHSIWWDEVIAVGIEHPAGKFGVGPLLRIQGAVLSCIPARMLVQPWPPASWRKAVGLKGNCTKQDVIEMVRWTAMSDFWNDWEPDAFDAYSIAQATRTALHKEQAA